MPSTSTITTAYGGEVFNTRKIAILFLRSCSPPDSFVSRQILSLPFGDGFPARQPGGPLAAACQLTDRPPKRTQRRMPSAACPLGLAAFVKSGLRTAIRAEDR